MKFVPKQFRAQTSIEFILILGLALAMLIPATLVFNTYTTDSQNALINAQVNKVGSEILHLSQKMHASGMAWETLELTIPGAVKEIKVYNGTVSELVILYETERLSEAVFFAPINILNETNNDCSNGCNINVKPGKTAIRIESYNSGDVIINPN